MNMSVSNQEAYCVETYKCSHLQRHCRQGKQAFFATPRKIECHILKCGNASQVEKTTGEIELSILD